MITRKDLHTLVDQLPEGEWPAAHQDLLKRLAKHDPLLNTLLTAPEEDEPETAEEQAAIAEVYADIKAGQGHWIPHEEVKKRALELP